MTVNFLDVDKNFIEKMQVYRETPAGTPLIEACSRSPVVFAEKMLGVKPYAWQVYALTQWAHALEDRGQRANKEHVVLSSRQIGKSTVVAMFSLWATIFNKYPYGTGNNTSVGMISASEDQAMELLKVCKNFMIIGDTFMAETYKKNDKPVYDKFFTNLLDKNQENGASKISLKKWSNEMGPILLANSKLGSTLSSYPPTQVVLGKTFSILLIDEAGKTDRIDDTKFYDYVYHTGSAANALRIYTSTPWEPVGFFYNMVDPESILGSTANVLAFTIEAISLENPEYRKTVQKIMDDYNRQGKVSEINRGYFCQFVKGDLSYFDPDKVREMFTDAYKPMQDYRGQCDMGIDFGGKTTSRTVITISELTDKGIIRRLYKRVYNVNEDETLLEDVGELLKRFKVERIIPDNCPQGYYLIQEMVRRGWNVQPINAPGDYGMVFRSDKVKKYGAFRSRLNNGKIQSFKDDALQTEMLALQFNNGMKNSIIGHAPGYNDDEIDSFVASAYFYLTEEQGVKFYEF
jgi:hypothetical protein